MTTAIVQVDLLPGSPYNGTGKAGIIITSGVPSFFKVVGSELDRIVSVDWYPEHPSSVDFEMRELILLDNTTGTFMVLVKNNYLDTRDRAGHISFRLDTEETLTWPAITFGRVSVGPLWVPSDQGLITG